MKKRNLVLIFALMLFLPLLYGCGQSVKYVCSDGSVTTDTSKCPPAGQPITSITESKVIPQDVFTLQKGESIMFDGKKVRLLDVFSDGITYIDVSGVTREIKATNQLEIINGLEVIVKGLNYVVTDPDSSTATLKIDTLVLNSSEYLFFVDNPQVVEGVEVTVKGITPSYILVDTPNVLGMKIYPGNSKVFSGLNITNVKAFPRGIRVEDYAILRITRV